MSPVRSLAAFGSVTKEMDGASFADLDPERSLRVVVPSVVALTLGFQVALSSFFLSILGLSRTR